jgi:DNA-binding SARP family transcriptional activator
MATERAPRQGVVGVASRPARRNRASGARPRLASVRVLGSLQLFINGRAAELSPTSRRVLSYLALAGQPSSRSALAGSLWPGVPEDRALARLRTSLWRLQRAGLRLARHGADRLALAPEVEIDFERLRGIALDMLHGARGVTDEAIDALAAAPPVLPDSDDDWVLLERERFRLLRLHALETAAERLCSVGRYGLAIDLAVQLVSSDPLRETAQRLLMTCHLASGNRSEALGQLERYKRLLADELDLDPPDEIVALVQSQPVAVRGDPRPLVPVGGTS